MGKQAPFPDADSVREAVQSGVLGELVEAALAVLVGEPLSWLGRASDMGDFGFGPEVPAPTNRDPNRSGPTFALHVQCPFRFSGPDGPLFGSRDIYRAPDGAWIEEWSGREPNFYDQAAQSYIERRGDNDVVCKRVISNRAGDLRIEMTENHVLDVFAPGAVGGEYWRFFRLGDTSRHFVVIGDA